MLPAGMITRLFQGRRTGVLPCGYDTAKPGTARSRSSLSLPRPEMAVARGIPTGLVHAVGRALCYGDIRIPDDCYGGVDIPWCQRGRIRCAYAVYGPQFGSCLGGSTVDSMEHAGSVRAVKDRVAWTTASIYTDIQDVSAGCTGHTENARCCPRPRFRPVKDTARRTLRV